MSTLIASECDSDLKLKDLSDAYLRLHSGYDISRQEISKARKAGRIRETEGLGYGEVDVEAFAGFLKSLPCVHNEGTFLDLGSGSGKAVLAAAFSGYFSSCIGVEILEPLHNLASQALERAGLIDQEKASCARFELGDIFEKEDLWSIGDVILVTCTLFTDQMMARVNAAVNRFVRPGSIMITTTRRLDSPRARLLTECRVKYAKGSLQFIVYLIE